MGSRYKNPRTVAVLAVGVVLAALTLTGTLPGPSWFVAGLWGTWAGVVVVGVNRASRD